MNKFLERINAGEILVADGATGSNLQKMGLKPGRPPEDLIIDAPDTRFATSFDNKEEEEAWWEQAAKKFGFVYKIANYQPGRRVNMFIATKQPEETPCL